jgi:tellurite resistance protein
VKRLTINGNTCTETLALLIAVAWADGRLDDDEKAGVRGAAQVFNLTKVLRDRVEELLEKPAKVSELLLEPLSTRDRAFAYVAAAWMAHVDGVLDPAEKVLLDEIAAALDLGADRQAELAKVARGLEPLPEGARKWSEEITRLFKAIPAQLEEPGSDFEVAFE